MKNLHEYINAKEKEVLHRAGSYFVERHPDGWWGVFKYPRNHDLTGGHAGPGTTGCNDTEDLIEVCNRLAKKGQ